MVGVEELTDECSEVSEQETGYRQWMGWEDWVDHCQVVVS